MSRTVRVKVHCPRCGDVRLPLADIQLSIETSETTHYTFRCPSCRDLISRPADARMQRVLTRNDVSLSLPDLTGELRDTGAEPEFVDDDEA